MRKEQQVVTIAGRKYGVMRPWGTLPDGVKLGLLSKVAVDSRDNVYVAQRSDPPVVVFDREGRFVGGWGEDHLSDVHGIFITREDHVLLVDRDAHQILGFDTEGKLLFTLGDRDQPRFGAPFNHPTDIAVAPNGDMYVADGYANSLVHWFSPDGEFNKTWGQPGNGPGEFTTPHGIWILEDGRVLVGDRENDRVQVFSSEGEYLTEWGDFYHPMDVFADTEGLIYISDQIPRLSVLTPEGELIGRCRPCINIPHGIRGDSEGNIYVVDTRWNELTKLERHT